MLKFSKSNCRRLYQSWKFKSFKDYMGETFLILDPSVKIMTGQKPNSRKIVQNVRINPTCNIVCYERCPGRVKDVTIVF